MIYFISTDEEEIKGRKILNFRGIFSISFFEELISFLRFSGGKTGKRATCAFDWLQSATDPLFFSFDARASPPPSRKNRREKEKGREREKNRKKKKERAFANKSSRDPDTNGKINLRKKKYQVASIFISGFVFHCREETLARWRERCGSQAC